MKLENLKKGLFGYQKASVYVCIAAIEEEFSNKLMEKEAQAKKEGEQYQIRIQQLEKELRNVRQECEKLKNEQMIISNTLLDAKRYAETLKKETEEKERTARQQLEEAIAQKQQEVNQYANQIQNIRETFRKLLNQLDAEVQGMEQQVETLKEEAPNRNMVLFQRKKESAE